MEEHHYGINFDELLTDNDSEAYTEITRDFIVGRLLALPQATHCIFQLERGESHTLHWQMHLVLSVPVTQLLERKQTQKDWLYYVFLGIDHNVSNDYGECKLARKVAQSMNYARKLRTRYAGPYEWRR